MWSAASAITIQDNSETSTTLALNDNTLFPAARTDWILKSGRGAKSLTIKKILLWLDFAVINPSTTTDLPMWNEIRFWIYKYRSDGASQSPGLADYLDTYAPPVAPSLTSPIWLDGGGEENDGLDPYLWTHRLTPVTMLQSYGNLSGTNTLLSKAVVTGEVNAVTYPLSVRQAWQPDVTVRAARRLGRAEGLMIGFGTPGSKGGGLNYSLTWAARVLTS